ncbi:MAG: arylesterase [Gammaproteobacteria bacterium]|jgi:acyl-CoA thioesterase-1|nr:arylesterase [Gammaproteobacteria bacterium]
MAFSTFSDIRWFSRSLLLFSVVCLIFGFSSVSADETENKFRPPTIVVFGDSLSAAFGINQDQGWVHLLQKRLSTRYYQANVINASISGETSQGGLSRISQVLDTYNPDIVLLELGGNDGLQGLPLALMKDNLDRTIQIIQAKKSEILLLGIHLPPNYGKFYTEQFDRIYQELAEKYDLPLVPFLLQDIATNRDLMQDDGIHPKANAQNQILENVWPQLKKMIPQRQLR